MADRQNLIDDCVSLIKSDDKFGLESNRTFYNEITNSNVKIKDYISDYYENHKVELGIAFSTFETMIRKEINKIIYDNYDRMRDEEFNKKIEEDKKRDFYILESPGKLLANSLNYWYSIGFRLQENTHAISIGDEDKIIIVLINEKKGNKIESHSNSLD